MNVKTKQGKITNFLIPNMNDSRNLSQTNVTGQVRPQARLTAWRTAPAPSMTKAPPGTSTTGPSVCRTRGEGGEGGIALADKGVKAGMRVSENVCFENKNGSNKQILDGNGGGVFENIRQTNVRQSVKVFEKKWNSGGKITGEKISEDGIGVGILDEMKWM